MNEIIAACILIITAGVTYILVMVPLIGRIVEPVVPQIFEGLDEYEQSLFSGMVVHAIGVLIWAAYTVIGVYV